MSAMMILKRWVSQFIHIKSDRLSTDSLYLLGPYYCLRFGIMQLSDKLRICIME